MTTVTKQDPAGEKPRFVVPEGPDITVSESPNSFFLDVSAELANYWLETRNIRNRNLTGDRASEYAGQIKSGEWMINGDTIRFGWPVDGEPPQLLDGQHRLEGIRRSGLTVPCLIVTGLDPRSQDTMDQGTVRTAVQVLGMNGFSDASNRRAAGQLAWAYENGRLGKRTSRERRAPTHTLVQFVEKHDESLTTAISQGWALRRHHTGAVGTAAAAYWIIARAGEGRAAAFWGDMLDGGSHGPGHPVFMMRRALVNEKGKRRKTESRVILAWYLICWNAYNADKEIHFLSWRSESQAFPQATELVRPTASASAA